MPARAVPALLVALVALAPALPGCEADDLPALNDDVDGVDGSLPVDAPDPDVGEDGRPDTAEPEPDEIDDDGPPGAMGAALLSGGVPAARLEVDASPGATLSEQARDALAGALQAHGGKRVELTGADALSSRDVWPTATVVAEAAAHRATRSSTDAVSVHVLVLDGRHEDESVLGLALDASTIAVFPEQIGGGLLDRAGVSLEPGRVEEAVAVHELGHLFGLVNLTGQGAFHEDAEHPGHSSSEGSVMHWAVETDLVAQVFEGGPPTDFDEADETEMARIRST